MQTYHLVLFVVIAAALCIDKTGAGIAVFDAFNRIRSTGPPRPVVSLENPWPGAGRLEYVEQLGQGGFGVVCKAYDVLRRIDVAAKEMAVHNRKEFDNEVSMMQLTGRHNNIVRMYDVFEYDDYLLLTMEVLAGGDLYKMIEKKGTLTMAESAALLKSMATAVKHLHDRNIVHHDLKPKNFAFRHETRLPEDLILIDFGLSRHHLPGDHHHCKAGSPVFVPRFRKDGPCSLEHMKLSDSFALGRTLFIMLFGQYPNPKLPIGEQIEVISDPILQHLLRHLTSDDPYKLITVDEILAHPFLLNTQHIHASRKARILMPPSVLTTNATAIDRFHHDPSRLFHNSNPFAEDNLSLVKSGRIPAFGTFLVRDRQGTVLRATIMRNMGQTQQMISHELSVLKQCGSGLIVNVHQAYAFGNKLLFVHDMLHGSKLHVAVSGRMLSEKTAAKWFQRIVGAVAKLHDNGFTHGQLGLESFAFQLSNRLDPMGFVMLNVGNNGGSVREDILNLGVILHTLVTGVQPYIGRDGIRYITSLDGLDAQLGNLLIDLIVTNKIASCQDILDHPFMKKKLATVMDMVKRKLGIF